MASTGAILVGVYGLIRGLLAILGGLAFAIGGSIIGAAGGAAGVSGMGALGGLLTIIGVVMLLAGIVMWVASIGAFMEKGWAPILAFLGFGVLVVTGLLQVVQGGIGIFILLTLALDAAAAGWGAINAPQIPVGNSPKQAQAV